MSKIAKFEIELGKKSAFVTRLQTALGELETAQAQLEDLEKEVNPNFSEIQVLIKTIADRKEELKYYNKKLEEVSAVIQSMKADVEHEIGRTAYLTIKEPIKAQFKALFESFIGEALQLQETARTQSDTYISSINPSVLVEINGYGARYDELYGLEQLRATGRKYL